LCPYAKVIWNIKVSPKIKAFIWKVINRTLLTWDSLIKRSWQGLTSVLVCMDGEFINHMFLRCLFTLNVREKLAQCLKMHIPQLPQLRNFFGHLGDIPFKKNEIVIWNLAATTIFLEIWRERNNRIFNESAISSNQTFHVYLSFISFWLNLLSRTYRDVMRHAL